jgi:hypothetical protein
VRFATLGASGGGLDETQEERMGTVGARLEFGVRLRAHEEWMVY